MKHLTFLAEALYAQYACRLLHIRKMGDFFLGMGLNFINQKITMAYDKSGGYN